MEEKVKQMTATHKHNHKVGIDTIDHLVEHLLEVLTVNSVIVCVGNEICGDDAAGPAVAKQIDGKVCWKVFDVQTVPESFLMKIVELAPDTVLIVDALNFDAPAGTVEIFASEKMTGQGPSTHGPAPIAFLDVLNMFHPCKRAVLGIQPVQSEFGSPMCKEVADAVDFVSNAFVVASKKLQAESPSS